MYIAQNIIQTLPVLAASFILRFCPLSICIGKKYYTLLYLNKAIVIFSDQNRISKTIILSDRKNKNNCSFIDPV